MAFLFWRALKRKTQPSSYSFGQCHSQLHRLYWLVTPDGRTRWEQSPICRLPPALCSSWLFSLYSNDLILLSVLVEFEDQKRNAKIGLLDLIGWFAISMISLRNRLRLGDDSPANDKWNMHTYVFAVAVFNERRQWAQMSYRGLRMLDRSVGWRA